MNEDDKKTREKRTSRDDEALGDVGRLLTENPVLHQLINAALGARDIANSATGSALKNLNVATASDLERFTRRLRSVSDRLEAVEDRLDEVSRELAAIRTKDAEERRSPDPRETELNQDRLGLSE